MSDAVPRRGRSDRRDPFATAIRHIIAPAWARWERSPYLNYYRRFLRSQRDPAKVVVERQWNATRAIISHAYTTTAFYRDRCEAVGITPNTLYEPQDLLKLPLLR